MSILVITVLFVKKSEILPKNMSKAMANIVFARNLVIQDNK